MTIETLFGKEEATSKPRTIKFKQIKAVYETLTVKEDIAAYLKAEGGWGDYGHQSAGSYYCGRGAVYELCGKRVVVEEKAALDKYQGRL